MADVPRQPAVVRLRDGGPVVVPGDLPVRAGARVGGAWRLRALAVPTDDDRGNVALCRCGASGDRPSCDGTHRGRDVGPDDTVDPPAPAGATDRVAGSGLPSRAVVVEDGGPIRLGPDVAVRLPDGTVVDVPDGTGLCRCGRSGARPWCDRSQDACATPVARHGR